jgi:hypothetical protein
MAIRRTHFTNRITDGELMRLLESREGFSLENVEHVDSAASQLGAALTRMGWNFRVRDDRSSLGRDLATTVLPVWAAIYPLWRIVRDRLQTCLARPPVTAVIVKRVSSLEVRYRGTRA